MTPRLLTLIPSAVAINLAIGRLVAELALPVYLDTIGTILTAVLAGPLAGIVTGLTSQVLSALLGGYVWLAFAPIQVLIALLAAVAAVLGGFRSLPRGAGWGALVGVLAGAASAVISYFVFKGVTVAGVTALTALLRGSGLSLPEAVVSASILTDIVDKTLAFLLVGMLLQALPLRTISRFPWALRAARR